MEIEILKPLAFGVFSIGFGLYTLITRIKAPHKFGKLEAMKKYWGPKRGTNIHIIGYTVLPMIFGTVFLAVAFLEIWRVYIY